MNIAVVQVTDDNRDALVRIALSMYLGETCKYCGHVYETLEDMHNRAVVYAGYHATGRTACGACWSMNNPVTDGDLTAGES